MTIDLLQNFSSNINKNWTSFKQNLSILMDKHILSKMTTTWYNLHWLNTYIKKELEKKKHYLRNLRKTNKPEDKQAYVNHK